jgi:hypothetical protein
VPVPASSGRSSGGPPAGRSTWWVWAGRTVSSRNAARGCFWQWAAAQPAACHRQPLLPQRGDASTAGGAAAGRPARFRHAGATPSSPPALRPPAPPHPAPPPRRRLLRRAAAPGQAAIVPAPARRGGAGRGGAGRRAPRCATPSPPPPRPSPPAGGGICEGRRNQGQAGCHSACAPLSLPVFKTHATCNRHWQQPPPRA